MLGKNIVANSWSENGLVEGIELPGTKLAVAVQSHPESLGAETEKKWRKLFSALVDKASSSLGADSSRMAM